MNERRRMTGVVTSNKMQKTVVVQISRTFRHPLYRKVVHTFNKVQAQDELGCDMGDLVQIVESRPLSAKKRWVVEAIIKRQVAPVTIELVDEVEAVENEPVETEPVKTEPVKTKPVKTKPVKIEPVETEPVETEPVETEPVETEPVETEPVETEPGQGA